MVNGTKIAANTEHALSVNDRIVFGKNIENTEFRYIFTTKSGKSPTPNPNIYIYNIYNNNISTSTIITIGIIIVILSMQLMLTTMG